MDKKKLFENSFNAVAEAFNKIPFLKKLQGYRALIGYAGLAVVAGLFLKGVIGPETALIAGGVLEAFKDLALNAKGRK